MKGATDEVNSICIELFCKTKYGGNPVGDVMHADGHKSLSRQCLKIEFWHAFYLWRGCNENFAICAKRVRNHGV